MLILFATLSFYHLVVYECEFLAVIFHSPQSKTSSDQPKSIFQEKRCSYHRVVQKDGEKPQKEKLV